ncbi:MAG: tetratricopeptide repeat protein [Syntrophobacterales bacterium]|nr:MAG: tetratricopeptide repeat protein [Syntrophobacterales bacterium]
MFEVLKNPGSKIQSDHYRMPYHPLGNGFVDRENELRRLHDILVKGKNAVVEDVGMVIGTGGIGKTQLAIEYVYSYASDYPGGIFWIDAELGLPVMISQISEAAELPIDTTRETGDQLHDVWAHLNRCGPALLVLDNFPDDDPLDPWLPTTPVVHVLVTTRRRDLASYSRIPLDFMTLKEGTELLNKGERRFGEDTDELVKTLGGLPLALKLARNHLNVRRELTVADLIKEIAAKGENAALESYAKLYTNELSSEHIKEIATVFQISYEHASDFAKRVLQVLAFLAPVPVPRRLLKKIFAKEVGKNGDDYLADALDELCNTRALAEYDQDKDPLPHRLVAGFVREITKDKKQVCNRIDAALNDEMHRIEDEGDTAVYRDLEKVEPHAAFATESGRIDAETIIDLLTMLMRYNQQKGLYRLAKAYGQKALSTSETTLEPDHPSIAIRQSNLAMVLRSLGELNEARDLLRKALATWEKAFEPGHSSIAIRQSNLALVLKDLGEIEEARDLLRKACQTFLNKFGDDHPYTKIVKRNIDSLG